MGSYELYSMDLHQNLAFDCGTIWLQIVRVPGGWTYTSIDKGHQIMSSAFVPFDNEFQEKEG